MSKRTVTQHHIRQVKVAQKSLNLIDADYRSILKRVAGVESSKDLDTHGFDAVMAEFLRLGFESTSHAEQRLKVIRASGHVSYAQKLKIQRLWDAWKGKEDKDGLKRWLKKKWSIDDLRFMSSDDAGKIIKALLSFKKTESVED